MLRKGEPEGHLFLCKRPPLSKTPRACEKRQGVLKAFVKAPLRLRCAGHLVLQKQFGAFQSRDTIFVCADQHGQPVAVDGQCLHRAPLAIPEVRVRLLPCLRDRFGAAGWPWPVDHLLQHPASTRAWPGEPRWRPIGGSDDQTGGMNDIRDWLNSAAKLSRKAGPTHSASACPARCNATPPRPDHTMSGRHCWSARCRCR